MHVDFIPAYISRNIHLNILITSLFLFFPRSSSFIDHPLSHFVFAYSHTFVKYTHASEFAEQHEISRWRICERAQFVYGQPCAAANYFTRWSKKRAKKGAKWKSSEQNNQIRARRERYAASRRLFHRVKKITPVCARLILIPWVTPRRGYFFFTRVAQYCASLLDILLAIINNYSGRMRVITS
jgi:hypothetical protein